MPDTRTAPIRQAVAAEEYGRAAILWNELTVQVSDEINNGTCTEATLADIHGLVEWSRNIVACDLAHFQSQLTALWVESKYTQ